MDGVKVECQFCHRKYQSSFLHRHILRKHTNGVAEKRLENSRIKCTICQEKFPFRADFRKHISVVHPALTIVETENVFSSKEAFVDWLSDEEKRLKLHYVCRRQARKTKDNSEKLYILYCQYDWEHNSKLKSPEQRKRASRSSGSYKLDGSCPAGIDVRELSDGQVKIKYCRTHIGHGTDLCHFRLPVDERSILEDKIKENVSFSEILDGIRDNSNKDQVRKLDLINRKTLSNIAASLNMKPRQRSSGESITSFQFWIEKLRKLESHPFCFYKPRGTAYANLQDEDFMLVIITPIQSAILNEFAGDMVCVDSTFGTNKNGFQLTTLLLVDHHKEGFPVAFCFSNVVNTECMKIFFHHVRSTIKRSFCVSVFVSDDFDFYYSAWIEVMGEQSSPMKKLLCTWHTEAKWREKLYLISDGVQNVLQIAETAAEKCGKSQLRKKKAAVCRTLRTLLEEPDEMLFTESLHRTVTDLLADAGTRSFGKYFENEWARREYVWALCNRKNVADIGTHLRLENLHRSIRCVYGKGMKMNRLDSIVCSLFGIVRDEYFDRILKHFRTEIRQVVGKIEEAHAIGQKINDEDVKVEGNEFIVKSQTNDDAESCTVTKIKDTCSSGCDLICRRCDTCVHMYSCTCSEYVIKCNMCEHIHKVIAKYSRKESEMMTNQEQSKLQPFIIDVVDTSDVTAFLENEQLIVKAENVRSLIRTRNFDSHTLEKVNNSLELVIRLIQQNCKSSEVQNVPVNG